MNANIVIHVEGGVVQGVYSDEPVNVTLVDFDNLEQEGLMREAREQVLEGAIEFFAEVNIDTPSV